MQIFYVDTYHIFINIYQYPFTFRAKIQQKANINKADIKSMKSHVN